MPKIPKTVEWTPEPNTPAPLTALIDFSLLDRLKLRLGFMVHIGNYKGLNDSEPGSEYYAAICPTHGLYISRKHGGASWDSSGWGEIRCQACYGEPQPIIREPSPAPLPTA